MRVVNFLFLLTLSALLAIPVVGLCQNVWRSLPQMRSAYGSSAGGGSFSDLTAAVDQYVAANYGRRERMINYDARIRNSFGADTKRVAHGTDGYLFLKDGDVFSQVTGQRLDWISLQPLVDLASELQSESASKGRKFLVVVAPNKHTVYRQHLPVWARTVPAISEIDLLYDALKERKIASVDLRSAQMERADTEPVYWHGDTHWTDLGALIGFDQTATALGLPDAAIAPASVFKGSKQVNRYGDLVRIAGLGKDWQEIAPSRVGPDPFAMTGLTKETMTRKDGFETFRLSHKNPAANQAGNPRIMVIGDSFTVHHFGPLFMRVASQYFWTHHRAGAFDRKLIDEFDPDIVILEVVERSIGGFRAASPTPVE